MNNVLAKDLVMLDHIIDQSAEEGDVTAGAQRRPQVGHGGGACKTGIDMDDFSAMNEVYGRFFNENPPARATVQAARLPRDARVEIEAIAVMESEPDGSG